MKAGNPKIKETQVKFSKENQPSPKAYQLYKKANGGDLKAIELLMKVIPNFVVPTKVSNTDPEGNAMPMTKEDIEMMRIFNEHHSNIQKSE